MKRSALLAALVFAAALAVAVSSSASTYANGHFLSGLGYYTSAPSTAAPLDVSGNWKLAVDANGVGRLDGVLWTMKQRCGADPCPWGLNLKYFSWARAVVHADGSYSTTGTLDVSVGLDGVNPVHFDASFVRATDGQVTLTLLITNCPYHWGRWVIRGA